MKSRRAFGKICGYQRVYLLMKRCSIKYVLIARCGSLLTSLLCREFQKYAIAMPDVHEGYGFPIGGVAAMALDEGGVISPGGIGYDINCGVRLLASNLNYKNIDQRLSVLTERLFQGVPSGTGRGGDLNLNDDQLERYLVHGAREAVTNGFGNFDDVNYCEEKGCFLGANAAYISMRARERGRDQLGSLGSGNHFLEIQSSR